MIACRNSALIASIAGLCAAGGAAFGTYAADLPVLKSGLWEVSRVSTQQADEEASHHDVPRRLGAGRDARVQHGRGQGYVHAERTAHRWQSNDGQGHLQARPDDHEDRVGHGLQRQHRLSHRRYRQLRPAFR